MMNTLKLSLAASLASAMLATTASAVSPPWVRVRSISYAGSGCPAGTVAQNISPDNQAFTLLFDSYMAEVGPGIPLSQSRKNCAVNVDLEYPGGWTYSLFAVDYRGFANLQAGVVGTQRANYYFQGSSGPSVQSTLVGPRQADYQYRDTFPTVSWSTCRVFRALNINTQVRVDNSAAPGRSGIMTLDSIDGQIVHQYGISWRPC